MEAIVGWSADTTRRRKVFHRLRQKGLDYVAFCDNHIRIQWFGHPKDSGLDPCRRCFGIYAKDKRRWWVSEKGGGKET